MNDQEFMADIVKSVKRVVLKKVDSGDWLGIAYGERPKLPVDLLTNAYDQIDFERVLELVKGKLEEKVAEKIMHSMMTEIGNDVKSVMNNPDRREKLRSFIRNNIDEIVSITNS